MIFNYSFIILDCIIKIKYHNVTKYNIIINMKAWIFGSIQRQNEWINAFVNLHTGLHNNPESI